MESVRGLVPISAVPDVLAMVLGRTSDARLAGVIQGILLEGLLR